MTAVMGIYLFKFAFRRYGLKAACASLVLPHIRFQKASKENGL